MCARVKQTVQLSEVTAKQIYSLLHEDKYGIEVCKPRISKYLTEDIEQSLYFTNLQYIQDTKSREFQFKFLHDIHVNKYWLYKWGIKDSDICDYCNIHKEDIQKKKKKRKTMVYSPKLATPF